MYLRIKILFALFAYVKLPTIKSFFKVKQDYEENRNFQSYRNPTSPSFHQQIRSSPTNKSVLRNHEGIYRNSLCDEKGKHRWSFLSELLAPHIQWSMGVPACLWLLFCSFQNQKLTGRNEPQNSFCPNKCKSVVSMGCNWLFPYG